MYYLVRGLLYGISLLPFGILYLFSDLFYIIVYYLLKYRRGIVMQNLAIAFPEKTASERKKIARQFYRNLIDTFIESIKFISISEKQLEKRSSGDFEMINGLIAKGKNIHLMAAHQFNWEFANLLYARKLSIPFVGVYMPISNKIINRLFYTFRKKYGTVLISKDDFKNKRHEVFAKQYILALAADQNPGLPGNAYWMNFFEKPAPFVTGPAKGAVKNNTAVVFVGFQKIKRGHYHFTNSLLTENGADHSPEELTKMYRDALEKLIRDDPANYLWSHRRWRWDWKEEYGPILPG
ncbi:MAG TPA: lysophospholipid acyltransferase family protein [Chitinophagaceae bacterium]